MAIHSLPLRSPADRIDPETRAAVDVFLTCIRGAYAIAGAWLYGSRARGDHTRYSDADVAVLLEGPKGKRVDVMLEMSDLSYDIPLDDGIHTRPFRSGRRSGRMRRRFQTRL